MATASKPRVWRIIHLMLIVVFFCPSAYSKIIYVDDDAAGAGDGTNWTDAYVCLQDALTAARSGDEIRVAKGIYKPDRHFVKGRFTGVQASGDRTATFQLINGVTIKGGYAGFGEPDPDARDVDLYKTILSGDLNGDDVDVSDPYDLVTEPTRTENSYHVVTGSGTDETAVLDGLAITAGNANGNQPHDKGGGMLNDSGSPTVANCTFTGNSAQIIGGGMLNDVGSSTVVTNCTFTGNSARFDGGGMFNFSDGIPTVANCTFSGNSAKLGGGIYNDVESNTTVTNCTFSDNWAESQGGGMYNLSSHTTLINCIFSENSAEEWGGGIACIAGGLIIESCSIQNNWSEFGAGISCLEDCSPEISDSTICYNVTDSAVDSKGGGLFVDHSNLLVENCVFMANQASPVPPDDALIPGTGGGAICCANGANVVVTGSTFIDNISTDDGGAICCHNSCLQVTDGTFLRNSSADAGGAIYLRESQPVDVTNSLFAGNSATYYGGAIFYRDSTILNIYNCTLTNNSADTGGGIRCSVNDTVGVISNSILWDNFSPQGQQIAMIENAILQVRYCNIAGGAGDVKRGNQSVLIWDEGNMNVDPLFANPGYWVAGSPRTGGHDVWVAGDYHLKSEAGRWDPNSGTWVQDDVTSPCIDAGDPNSPIAFEPYPNGGVINMGAYGGMAEASKSIYGLCAKYSGGTGRQNDPYQIATAEDLMLLGESPEDYNKHFIMTADIDLDPNLPGRKVFDKAVIAPDTDSTLDKHGWNLYDGTPFTGVFDGNGHTISHLTIKGDSFLGLFGNLYGKGIAGAIISNLCLEAVDVNGAGDLVGGLVGYFSGSIITTYSTGTVIGEECVGGLTGYNSTIFDDGIMNYSTIDTCYSTVDVSGVDCVGGLVGTNLSGIITNCYATGSVVVSPTDFWSHTGGVGGGLVGENWYTISNCYATGSVVASGTKWSPGVGGGLVGENNGEVIYSFWDTQTSGQAVSGGGIPKTTAEMQTSSTFLEAGWDFADELANGNAEIWWILEGQDYPRLWWERTYEPPPEPETDETTILGMWRWDVETDTLGGSVNTDFAWSHTNSTKRNLFPINGAKAAIVSERSFEEVDLAFVNRLILSSQGLSGSDVGSVLIPGTVIAFRTSEGNKGKLRIEGYRASHDFSFPEASYLSEDWKSYTLTKPNREKYHLHVKWCLF